MIVSSYFADIFKGNALNNGLLPVQVSPEYLKTLIDAVQSDPETQILVNLEEQFITLKGSDKKESFEIDAYKKLCLLNGYDDIDFLISKKDKIEEFEKELNTQI